jgi:hypothetical protein
VVGGTSAFNSSDVPAIRVYGDGATIGSYTTTSRGTWAPSSLGLGWDHIATVTGQNANYTNYRFWSELNWDAANSRWRAIITNDAPAAGGANNRSFYAFGAGRLP